MNYKKIYEDLVDKAKPRGLDKSSASEYYEIHHITPRCFGGSDEEENLVMLTAREHILAHILLWKAYPKHLGLVNAARMMVETRGYTQRLPSRVLASLREESNKSRRLRTEGAGNGRTRHSNLEGQIFGRLTVQDSYTWHTFPNGQRKCKWLCLCECGNSVSVLVGALKSGYTQSCGCYQIEQISKAIKKWDMSKKTYRTYTNMLARCYSPLHKSNKRYQEYGIGVCESWLEERGAENFARDMGEKPDSMQLGRLNPYEDFSPENCKWMTKTELSHSSRKLPRTTKSESGLAGVKLDKRRGTYTARIVVNGREISKTFKTFEEAKAHREFLLSEYG